MRATASKEQSCPSLGLAHPTARELSHHRLAQQALCVLPPFLPSCPPFLHHPGCKISGAGLWLVIPISGIHFPHLQNGDKDSADVLRLL